MDINEATAKRIQELCTQKTIPMQELASRAGLPLTLLAGGHADFGIVAIETLCRVLGISECVFFSAPIFFSSDLSEEG